MEETILRLNDDRLEKRAANGAYLGWVCSGPLLDWAWSGDADEPIAVLRPNGRVETWSLSGAYLGWVCEGVSGRLRLLGDRLVVERRGEQQLFDWRGAYLGRL